MLPTPLPLPYLNTCIIICGATASGKTALALALAKHFNTSIISADSRQCYKELNIAVAKPTNNELATVPHYFINTLSITEPSSAAYFEQYALQTLSQLFKKNKVVIMCGGTGLYIKAFSQGLDDIPTIPNNVRQAIITQYEAEGLPWLQQAIQKEDIHYWQQGETHNPQRLMRALEVMRATGTSITLQQKHAPKSRNFNIIPIAIDIPRHTLYQQINSRVDDMVIQGLEAEAKQLLPHQHLIALQTVGYTEMFAYLQNMLTLPQAIADIKQHTRNYAKRQITWFKKDKNMVWLPPSEILDYVKTYELQP